MKRYLYNYQTIVTFSEPVSAHSVMLRCQPAANAFQTIEQEHVVASPDYWLTAGTDAFGNRILFGGSSEPHTVFAYVSTGIVAASTYFQKQQGENMFLYRQPSRMTQLDDAMREAAATETRGARRPRMAATETRRGRNGPKEGDIRRGDRERPPLIGESESELLGCFSF